MRRNSLATASLGLILLQACGCGMNRQVVDNEDSRPFWEPRIRQTSHAEPEELPEIKELGHAGDTHVSFARWRQEVNDFPAARAHYELALQEEPEHLGALLGFAQLELEAGNTAAAEQLLTRAEQVDSESAAVAFSLGRLRASQRRWDDAVEAYNRAALADPSQTAYRFQLAVAQTHAGKVDQAMPNFIRTVGEAEAHYNVGRILHDKGLLEEAEGHFAMAVNMQPELEAAHEWLNRTRLGLRSSNEGGATAQSRPVPNNVNPIQTVGYVTPAG